MKSEPNKIFFLAAALAATAVGTAVLLTAAAVHKYRHRRAWLIDRSTS